MKSTIIDKFGPIFFLVAFCATILCSCSEKTTEPEKPAVFSWQKVPVGITWHGVWGNDESSFFVVGDGGAISYYDGITFTEVSSPTENVLYGIWGSFGVDVLAVGEAGTIIRYRSSN